MGPELLSPQRFGFKDSRPTRHSDCYALGMVVYEVLSRRVPFYQDADLVVFGCVFEGKRPERPRGAEGAWFTDDVWRILERCWIQKPSSRPSIKDVLQCMEKASRCWIPLPPWTVAGAPTTDLPSRDSSDSSIEGSTDEGEVPPPSQGLSEPSLELSPRGDTDENNMYPSTDEFSALLHEAPNHQDPRAYVKDSKGPDWEESVGIPGMVGGTGPHDGFLH